MLRALTTVQVCSTPYVEQSKQDYTLKCISGHRGCPVNKHLQELVPTTTNMSVFIVPVADFVGICNISCEVLSCKNILAKSFLFQSILVLMWCTRK